MKKLLFILISLLSFSVNAQLTRDQVKALWEPRVFPSKINIDSTWNAVMFKGEGGGGVSGSGTVSRVPVWLTSTSLGNPTGSSSFVVPGTLGLSGTFLNFVSSGGANYSISGATAFSIGGVLTTNYNSQANIHYNSNAFQDYNGNKRETVAGNENDTVTGIYTLHGNSEISIEADDDIIEKATNAITRTVGPSPSFVYSEIIGSNGDYDVSNAGELSLSTVGVTTITADSIILAGKIRIPSAGTPGNGKVLTSNSKGVATWQTPSGGGVSGSGTVTNVPVWLTSSSLGNPTGKVLLHAVDTLNITSPVYVSSVTPGISLSPDNAGFTDWWVNGGGGSMGVGFGSFDYLNFTSGGTTFTSTEWLTNATNFGVNTTGNIGLLAAGTMQLDASAVIVGSPFRYTNGGVVDGGVLTSDAGGNASWKTPGYLLTDTLTITAAQLKTANSIPIDLIAAPGAGKYIRPITFDIDYTYATTPFTSTVVNIGLETAAIPLSQLESLINSGSSVFGATAVNGGVGAIVKNKKLQFTTDSDSVTGGGHVKVYITYQIVQ